MANQISIGTYLFSRLKKLGVDTVFGVPGDYELVILDMIPEAGLTWRGNPNELIAGYAADGYARVAGVGAFVTTFGPGELSAYCCMAGQYAEYVPVVHVVGYPSTKAMNGKAVMHHSLGDGNFDMYHKMVQHICAASTVLMNPHTAAAEIDRVLNGYIGVPVDIGPRMISSSSLSHPLMTSLPPNDHEIEHKVLKKLVNLLSIRKSPVIIVDGGAVRNNFAEEGESLVKLLKVPYFATPMSKGGVSETIKGRFGGIYSGGASTEGVKKAVETADLVLYLGNYPSDFNTYDVSGKHVLQRLIKDLTYRPTTIPPRNVDWNPYPGDNTPNPGMLTQDFLWATLGRYFKPGDFVVAETGTSSYGIPAASLANVDNVRMYNQTIFGSIGYATGAALGSFVAGKENGSIKRNILVTGEGSLQLTVQTFSDLLRHELNATIFILNNDGYTVERLIHGMDASYNKVPIWEYKNLCGAFGPSFKSRYHRVETGNELMALLSDTQFNLNECTQVVELILQKHDAPMSVKLATAAVEEFNKRT